MKQGLLRIAGGVLVLAACGLGGGPDAQAKRFGRRNPHSPPPVELNICLGNRVLERSGRENCWISQVIEGQGRLCIPRQAAVRWLARPFRQAYQCGQMRARVSLWSPPQNTGHSPKTVLKTLTLQVFKSHTQFSLAALVLYPIERTREWLSKRMQGPDSVGILRRLILNQKNPSTRDHAAFLRLIGFVHLFTATGIHLYACARWVEWGVRELTVRARLPVPLAWRFARGLSAAIWLGLWMMSGMRPGMLRPLGVVALRTLARGLGFKWTLFSPLFLALGADLGVAAIWALNGQAWAPGRIHYALAVGGGLLAMQAMRTEKPGLGFLGEHLGLAVGSWIFPAIWDLFETQGVALATPLLSVVTIPVCALGVYPISILSAFVGWDCGIEAASIILNRMIDYLEWASVYFRTLYVIPLKIVGLSIGVALFAALVGLGRSERFKTRLFLGVCFGFVAIRLALESVWKEPPRDAPAQEVQQIDVGQGDAAWVAGADYQRTGLIDVGSEFALGRTDWISFFMRRGIFKLDWVALTHLDADHAGGLRHLVEAIPIDCVAIAQAELNTERGKNLERWLRTRSIQVDSNGCFPYTWIKPQLGKKQRGGNFNMSGFVVPLAQNQIYLNYGDADAKTEARFLDLINPWVQDAHRTGISILFKVSHHGSRFSSEREFLHKLKPSVVWISSGVENRYGHPTVQTLRHLTEIGVPIRRTDREGLLTSKAFLHQPP